MASLSRRHFLGTAALTGAGALLAACGAQAGTGAAEEAAAPEGDGQAKDAMMEKSPVVFWYTGIKPWDFDREEIPKQIRAEFDETTNYTLAAHSRQRRFWRHSDRGSGRCRAGQLQDAVLHPAPVGDLCVTPSVGAKIG